MRENEIDQTLFTLQEQVEELQSWSAQDAAYLTERLPGALESIKGKLAQVSEWEQEYAHQCNGLSPLTQSLNLSIDIPQALSAALQQITELAGVDGGECHLVEDIGFLTFTAHWGLDEAFVEASQTMKFPVGEGIPGIAYASGKPVYVEDAPTDERYFRGELAAQSGYRSLICVPIIGRDGLLGTFMLYSRSQRRFTTNTEHILEIMGGELALTISKLRLQQKIKSIQTQLNDNLERREAEIQALSAIAAAAVSKPELETYLETVLDIVCPLMQVDLCAVCLPVASDLQRLRVIAQRGMTDRVRKNLEFVSAEEGFAAEVYRTGKTVTIEDVAALPKNLRVKMKQLKGRALAIVPLRFDGQVLGLLGLITQEPRLFSESDITFINAVGDLIGSTLENKRLNTDLRHSNEDLRLMNEINEAVNRGDDLETITRILTDETCRIFSSYGATVYLLSEDKKSLRIQNYALPPSISSRIKALLGRPIPTVEFPLAVAPLHRTMIETSKPCLYTETTQIQQLITETAETTTLPGPVRKLTKKLIPQISEILGIYSIISVPMLVEHECIGILEVSSKNLLTASDMQRLEAIAKQVTAAIQHKKAEDENRRRADQQKILAHLAHALNEAIDPQEVLESTLEQIVILTGVDGVECHLADPEGLLSLQANNGLDPEFVTASQGVRFPVGEGIPGIAFENREIVYVPDAANDARYWRRDLALKAGYHSLLCVPILGRKDKFGTFMLYCRELRQFTEDIATMLMAVGQQIAIALERAQLHEQVKAQRIEEQEQLIQFSQTLLGLLDHQAIAAVTFAAIQKYLQCDSIGLLMPDDADTYLELIAAEGWAQDFIGQLQLPLEPSEKSCPAQALRTRQPVFVDLTRTDQAFDIPDLIRQSGMKACLNVPMLADERTIGLLFVESKMARTFSQDETRFLALLANHAAQALERARIFKAEYNQRSLAESLSNALAAGAELSTTLDFDQLLDMLLEQVAAVIPYDAANIMLVEGKNIRVAIAKGYSGISQAAEDEILGLLLDIENTPNLKRMAETGKPLIIPDTSQETDWQSVEGVTQSMRSWAGAPIVIDGQAAIFFSLDKREENFYQPQHIPLLEAFAGQAALAVQNTRSFDAEKRRAQEAETLHQIGSVVVSTLDQNVAIERVLEQLERVVPYDSASVQLLKEGYLEIVGGRGWPDEEVVVGLRFPVPGDNPNTVVIQERRAHILSDAPANYLRFGDGPHQHIQSWLGVPLIVHERVIGMLAVDSAQPDFYSQEHARLISAFANQVAIALENARMVETLRNSEVRYRGLFDGVPVGLYRTTPDGKLLDVNNAMVAILRYPNREALLEVNAAKLYANPQDRQRWQQVVERDGITDIFKVQLRRYDRNIIWVEENTTTVRDINGQVKHYDGSIRDITERAQAEDELRNLKEFNEYIIQTMTEGIVIQDAEGYITFANPAAENMLRYDLGELVGIHWTSIIRQDQHHIVQEADDRRKEGIADSYEVECLRKDNSYFHVLVSGSPRFSDGVLTGFLVVFTDISPLKEREKTQLRRAKELEVLAQLSADLRDVKTVAEMLPIFLRQATETVNGHVSTIYLKEPKTHELVLTGNFPEDSERLGARHQPGDGIIGRVAENGEIYICEDLKADPLMHILPEDEKFIAGVTSTISIPLRLDDGIVIGVINIGLPQKHNFSREEISLLTAIAEMASSAIHRASLHEQTQQHLQRLSALHEIDMAISANLDIRVTLNILLEQVTTQLKVDAVAVSLIEPSTHVLRFKAGRGFSSSQIEHTSLRLGEGQAGLAALEKRIIHVPDLNEIGGQFLRAELVDKEKFVSYYALPLIAKGEVKGVLEIFHRSQLYPSTEWMDFLKTLSVQTAIAIDNATLFRNLERSNIELTLAYETTLEGWARALDLRDRETEGHTRRVTETTIQLARMVGIHDEELAHIRRGSLLHDIGKMGVPDSILLKPGKLNDEEWEIMRQHPVYAYQMLSPIAFLRPALDIPYCHHEKWDGTGYPRGLRGEQIPLSARIFSIVDVWDALRSDRPYRAAWSEEKVLAYIQEQKGKHFDPQVVEAFLKFIV